MDKHKEHFLDIHLNPNVSGLKPSATVAINDLSNELKRQGREIFKLGLGQSPFPVPEPEELAARIAYVDSNGKAALDAVASIPESQPISEEFLKTYCGKVIKAIDRMCDWVKT